MPDTAPGHVSGFVSILGRPNSGKSTLLNALVGSKLAIVTAKPQTTRALVQGVLTLPNAQVVFLDTPGIHAPDTLLNRRMMDSIRSALDERDLLLFLADASRPFSERRRGSRAADREDQGAGVPAAEQGRPRQGQGATAAADRTLQGGLTISPTTFPSRR